MIVCSNLGPTIALLLGCWLLAHVVSLFGACNCRCFSPSSADSTIRASIAPPALNGVALLSEMFCTGAGGFGLFGCSRFSRSDAVEVMHLLVTWVLLATTPLRRTRADDNIFVTVV